MNVTTYLAKQYPQPPCWALVADVYATELGRGVDSFSTINSSIRAVASAFRLAIHNNPNGFQKITEPAQFCVVLMGTSARLGLHHCGVFIDGKVLHAIDSCNQYQELSVIRDSYPLIEYWAKV